MLKEICKLYLDKQGWKFNLNLPDNLRSFVFIGAPHTSNYDFLPAMAVAYAMKRNARFVIKSEWMKFPMGMMMKPMGALGLDREKIKNTQGSNTDLMASLFKEHEELVLMISPEGTRSKNSRWKTGFYYIAEKANVPIVLAYADYEKKKAGIKAIIYPTHFEEDMSKIMDFYRGIKGKRPEKFALDSRFDKGAP